MTIRRAHPETPRGSAVQLVDVAPREGFQSTEPFIPAERNVEFERGLWEAGLRRIEVGSFVSTTAVALDAARDETSRQ